ncbi:hypothetical protein ABEB22_12675 [Thioclava sp. 'Guangxiensis']
MQTFYQAKHSRKPLAGIVCACAALLILLTYLDPIAQTTCARW